MLKNSILANCEFNEAKPAITLLMETSFSKEIRIAFLEGQVMKEHQTPFPITVEIVEGSIHFGVAGTVHELVKGDIISLDGGVPHDLKAIGKSIVRLTLSKLDSVKRVESI
ncbi:MAG: cupin [Cytophagaceae bacterium]